MNLKIIMEFYKQGLILFCFFLINSTISTGQIFKGYGAFINDDGNILTSAYVLGDHPESIFIEDFEGKRYCATLVKVDKSIDLALISINQEIKYFTRLRMDKNNEKAVTPILDEIVNIVGYQRGVFDPRGALVAEINSAVMRAGYFGVGIGSAYDCSGAPILDNNGLLIGFIVNETEEKNKLSKKGYLHPFIFGIDATILWPFLHNANVLIATSNKKDPFNLERLDQLRRIKEVVNIGTSFTVRIFCAK